MVFNFLIMGSIFSVFRIMPIKGIISFHVMLTATYSSSMVVSKILSLQVWLPGNRTSKGKDDIVSEALYTVWLPHVFVSDETSRISSQSKGPRKATAIRSSLCLMLLSDTIQYKWGWFMVVGWFESVMGTLVDHVSLSWWPHSWRSQRQVHHQHPWVEGQICTRTVEKWQQRPILSTSVWQTRWMVSCRPDAVMEQRFFMPQKLWVVSLWQMLISVAWRWDMRHVISCLSWE
jgi:hypothetical protein